MMIAHFLNELERLYISDHLPIVVTDGGHQFQIARLTIQQDQNSTEPRSVLAITFDTNS